MTITIMASTCSGACSHEHCIVGEIEVQVPDYWSECDLELIREEELA